MYARKEDLERSWYPNDFDKLAKEALQVEKKLERMQGYADMRGDMEASYQAFGALLDCQAVVRVCHYVRGYGFMRGIPHVHVDPQFQDAVLEANRSRLRIAERALEELSERIEPTAVIDGLEGTFISFGASPELIAQLHPVNDN